MANIDIIKNPFFVLELPTTATVVDVERQGKRILAELELERQSAMSFPSPFGRQPRDESTVRQAMAALRDPRMRAIYALFVPPRDRWVNADAEVTAAPRPRGYPELLDVLPAQKPWLRELLKPRKRA